MFCHSKSIAAITIIWVCIFLPTDTSMAATLDLSTLTAPAYVLMDADSGKVLQARSPHQKLPPASTTKLMTMLLALEAINRGNLHKNDLVTASQKAAAIDGTRIYLEEGEKMSLDDMIKSMALASANDASVAVAEMMGGSEENFAALMNDKAKEIGMRNSHFVNASGMPSDDHYSSAYDLALLAQYALARTEILTYTALKQHTLREGAFPLYNGNKLLWNYAGADGLKNGYTSAAKNCLIATAQRGQLRLIVVVLGCAAKGSQTSDATRLLDYGFDKYAMTKLVSSQEVCGSVKIKTGKVKEVAAVLSDDLMAIYTADEGMNFTRRQDLPASIPAPVKQGEKLGQMQILADGKLFKTVDLVAAADVERLSPSERIIHLHWGLKLLILSVGFLLYMRYRIRKKRRSWRQTRLQQPYYRESSRDYHY